MEEVATRNLDKQIAKLTLSLALKFQTGTADDRIILSAAINILTQAMSIASSNSSDALKLYNAASKTAALARGKSKNEV